jgi:hypothetical protein
MLDYVWESYGSAADNPEPRRVFNRPYKSRLAQYLIDYECADFALVEDVANAQKHMKLRRDPPRRTKDITSVGVITLDFRALERIGVKAKRKWFVVIERRDGTQVDFAPALENVVQMWERLIRDPGL